MGITVSKIASAANLFVKAAGKRSLVETRAQVFHGVNPALTYERSGKSFDLPRFITQEMKEARQMNKLASKQFTRPYVINYSSNTAMEDFIRVTSDSIELSYARAQWTNPKDGKVYHLLNEGETVDGKIIVRILDSKCEFVKNAILTPKTIAIAEPTDISANICSLNCNDKKKFKHYELLNIFAKRYNPFAKVKLIIPKDIDTLFNEIHKTKADYLSMSFGAPLFTEKGFRGRGKELKNLILNIMQRANPDLMKKMTNNFNNIPSGTRIFVCSGNHKNKTYELFLTQNRVEGVGGLNGFGKKHIESSSYNSIFTQHYEKYVYPVRVTKEGINISGLRGTDYAMDVSNLKLHDGTYIFGTSYSTPVRVAKLALNDMMEGIL